MNLVGWLIFIVIVVLVVLVVFAVFRRRSRSGGVIATKPSRRRRGGTP